jgi:hypothetical protein
MELNVGIEKQTKATWSWFAKFTIILGACCGTICTFWWQAKAKAHICLKHLLDLRVYN